MIMMGLVGMVMVMVVVLMMVLVMVVLIITIATFRHSTSSQDNFLTMIFATKLILLDEILRALRPEVLHKYIVWWGRSNYPKWAITFSIAFYKERLPYVQTQMFLFPIYI